MDFCHYIYMVEIIVTRGGLAIGDVVTSMERPIERYVYTF